MWKDPKNQPSWRSGWGGFTDQLRLYCVLGSMKRAQHIATIYIGLSLCSCGQAASVERSLEKDSQVSGLALVAVVGQGAAVIPFDQPARYYTLKWGISIPTFAPSGRVIAWNMRAMFEEPKVVIETINGAQLFRKALWRDLSLLSLSDKCGRIALLERSGPKYPGAFDLRWTSMDLSGNEFVDRMQGPQSHGADWSPDCRFIVYGKGDEIRLFDANQRTSVQIGRGYDPAWSPDGKTIVYRNSAGAVSFMDAKGQAQSCPLESHRLLGAIRWSPDGTYVSFIERISPARPALFSATTRLVACRAREGDCLTVKEFGEIRGYHDEFHWILGYRDFCRDCQPGEAF